MNRQDRYSEERDNRNFSTNPSRRSGSYGRSWQDRQQDNDVGFHDRWEGSYRGSEGSDFENSSQGFAGRRSDQDFRSQGFPTGSFRGNDYRSEGRGRFSGEENYRGSSGSTDRYRPVEDQSDYYYNDQLYNDQLSAGGGYGGYEEAQGDEFPYFGESSSQSIRDRRYGEGGERGGQYQGQRGSIRNQGRQSSSGYGRSETQSRQQRGQYWGVTPEGYKRTDERIREELCDRLASHGHFDVSKVKVEVKEGEIMLKGEVDSRQVKYEIESIADEILGASDVDNQLKVRKENNRQSQSSANRERIGGTTNGGGRSSQKSGGSSSGVTQ